MINEIKTIVNNYLNNAKLCNLTLGTVVSDGVKVSDRLTIPSELIKGVLGQYTTVNDKVRLIRNHGGQEFYIVEIIDRDFVIKGSTVKLSLDGVIKDYKVEDVIK